MKQGFGTNNTIRIRCYAILLGLGGLDVYDVAGKGKSQKFSFSTQTLTSLKSHNSEMITRDSGRNGYPRWNKTHVQLLIVAERV